MIMTIMKDKNHKYNKKIYNRYAPKEKYYITRSWNIRLMMMDKIRKEQNDNVNESK